MSILAQHRARVPLASLAAVIVWTGVQLGSLEVSAQPIYSAHQCRTSIRRHNKRQRCMACVGHAGRVFHKQGNGAGSCQNKAVHAPGPIRSRHDCESRIRRVGERGRCLACVGRGGLFHKQGAGAGFCKGGVVPHHGGDAIRGEPGCRARIGRVGKQRRCLACVRHGGVFHKRGASAGHCQNVAPGEIRTRPACAARVVRLPKRQRCMACVDRGGVFHPQGMGAGFCRGGAPLAPRGVVVSTMPGCVTHIGRPGKRRRCQACVVKGGIFHRQGGGAGFCHRGAHTAPPPPPPPAAGPIRAEPGCMARIGRPGKRRRCLACVRSGRVFHKRGRSSGFCAGPVVPRPTPGIIRTVHQCRTHIGRVSKQRRCVACVRRGGRYHNQGAAHGFCR